MAISYVASSSSTTATINAPTGRADGDIIICVASTSSTTSTAMTWPSGWNPIGTTANGSGVRTSIAWFEWNTGDATSWSLTLTGSSPAVACAMYRDVNRTAPFAAQSALFGTGTDSTPSTPAVVNPNAGCWGVAVFTQEDALSRSMSSVDNAFVERVEAGGSVKSVICDSNATEPVGSLTVTGTLTGAPDGGVSWLGFLAPPDRDLSDSDSFGADETESSTATLGDTDSVGATDIESVAASLSDTDSAGAIDTSGAVALTDTDSAGANEFGLEIGRDSFGVTETESVAASLSDTDSAGVTETELVANAVFGIDSFGADDAATGIATRDTDSAGAGETSLTEATLGDTDSAGAGETESSTYAPFETDSFGVLEAARIALATSDSFGATDVSQPLLSSFTDTDSFGASETARLLVTDSDSFGASDEIFYRESDMLDGLPRVRVVEPEDRIVNVPREQRVLKPEPEDRTLYVMRERRTLKVKHTSTTRVVEAGN